MESLSSFGSAAATLIAPADGVVAKAIAARHARRRPIRVISLVAAIVAMSLADLVITLIYVQSVGMGEGNPIARYVIDHGSPWLLIAWKSASVSVACIIFLRYRNRRSTEAACWFAAAVLVWLLVRWSAYADEAWRLTPALQTMPELESALWVRMGAE